jgi:hypothetical protein
MSLKFENDSENIQLSFPLVNFISIILEIFILITNNVLYLPEAIISIIVNKTNSLMKSGFLQTKPKYNQILFSL